MVQKITKKIELDLEDIKSRDRAKAKDEVAQFVIDKIQELLDQSRSPVKGVGTFKTLKKNGEPSFLFESGDMRSSIEAIPVRGGIEVGIFDFDEAQKADNHNKNSAASKRTAVPKRQFIPYKDEDFKDVIQKGIDRIIDSYKDASKDN